MVQNQTTKNIYCFTPRTHLINSDLHVFHLIKDLLHSEKHGRVLKLGCQYYRNMQIFLQLVICDQRINGCGIHFLAKERKQNELRHPGGRRLVLTANKKKAWRLAGDRVHETKGSALSGILFQQMSRGLWRDVQLRFNETKLNDHHITGLRKVGASYKLCRHTEDMLLVTWSEISGPDNYLIKLSITTEHSVVNGCVQSLQKLQLLF